MMRFHEGSCFRVENGMEILEVTEYAETLDYDPTQNRETLLTSQAGNWTPVGPFLRYKAHDLEQGSANYGPWTDHIFLLINFY